AIITTKTRDVHKLVMSLKYMLRNIKRDPDLDGPNCQDQVLQVSLNDRVYVVCRQSSHGSSFPMEWYRDDGRQLYTRKEYSYEGDQVYMTMTHEFFANIIHHNTVFWCTLYPKKTGPGDLASFNDATCPTRIEIV
ncbi:unnamed protein product, partial [Owenia fusiformis]